jgi:putative acetyltransferase
MFPTGSEPLALIRRARPEDAREIHESHMRSIRELCAADYTAEEVNAWSGRFFNEDQRLRGIALEFVWVVEAGGRVLGHGQMAVEEKEGQRVAYVRSLYFTPEVKGKGLGQELMRLMLEEAKRAGARRMVLESSLTSLGFYEKLGFRPTGPAMRYPVAGVGVRCVPMELVLL